MKCACGCGKEISNQKAKHGGRFLNRKHAAVWRGRMMKGKKLGHYSMDKIKMDIDYSKGKEFCEHYDNDNIKCVMCLENYISRPEECPLGFNKEPV